METQKYRINRNLTGTTWSIPCTGTTNVWPMNTSTNCTDIPVKKSSCKDIYNYINGNTNDFPDDLKECSPTTPCIILWDCITPSVYNIPLATNIKCSNLEGYNYVKFTGLKVTCTIDSVLNSYYENFEEIKKIITVYKQRTGVTLTPNPQVTDCDCINPLNDVSHRIQIYLSQDFNDIGHYDLWDGNMSQEDLFANFTISSDSSGFLITLTNTMNYSYYDELAPFTYTIDWGDTNTTTLNSNIPSASNTYLPVESQRTIKLIQNTPWGPMTSSKLLTLPLNSYPQMFGQAYLAGDFNNPNEPFHTGTGIGPNKINVTGFSGGNPPGSSSAYHGRYQDFPLDSATDIDQFSGMSFTGSDCYVVTGVTESILGNFQSYTMNSDPLLPPGYLEGVWVPIGGDVVNPLNNVYQTGMYGVITTATTTYTAYTVSSSFGATNNNADGDTPITFYDFSNGITIFEADSCGLDKRALGALACIDCPEDSCEWCENKDEYYDRVDGINIQIPTINNRQTWIPHPVVDYVFGDLVYDETFNSCCCFIAVKDITPSDEWYGKPPSTSNEGKFLDSTGNEVHVWEACSYDCINCGLGTQTPCNDTTNPGWTGEVYGVNTTNFTIGDYAEDEHGNCYEAMSSGILNHPTGSTIDWDYIGCVSWICPSSQSATECIMISGPQQGTTIGEISYQGCMDNLTSPNGCFPPQYACPNLYDCVGCLQINSVGPNSSLYNGPSAFNSMLDCVQYCNPIAWSCSTPTGSNCCYELSCDNTQSQYISTVGLLGPTTSPATNGQLISFKNTYDIYVGPYYDGTDCATGCCVNTSWSWSCGEDACILGGGPPNGFTTFYTEPECETYTLTLSQYSGQNATNLEDIICGWTCQTQNIDCVYQPCEPCYFNGCGQGEEFCNINCSANTTCGCWVCNCMSPITPSCTLQDPCTATTLSLDYLPSGYYVSGGDIFDTNGDYVAPLPGGPNPGMGSYSGSIECDENCLCDTGWDCWLAPDVPPVIVNNTTINTNPNYALDANGNVILNTTTSSQASGSGGLSSIGMCSNPGSVNALANLGYEYSQPPPFTGYTSFLECCENTGCCYAMCQEANDPYSSYNLNPDDAPYYITEASSWGYNTANGFPANTITPCHWSDMYGPNSGPCNDPASGIPYNIYWEWCSLDICNQYAVISGATPADELTCTTPPGECDCACGSHPDFTGSTGGWNGSNAGYELGDAVSWADADTDYCCFICVCVDTGTDWSIMANITAAIGNQSMLDCNIMEPDLSPASQGLGNVVNCWESCNLTPESNPDPTNLNTCVACGSNVTNYYECSPDGCVTSLCTNPADPLCYTTSNCDGMCDASCFCNGYNTTNCTDSCVTQEVVTLNPFLFNFLNTCGPFNYVQGTLNQCNTNLSNGSLECCGDEQWYCDGSAGCSQVNLQQISVNVTSSSGLGCVRVYPSDIQYETTLTNNYTTQFDCQVDCRWICDPNGAQTCTFSFGAPLITSFPSAFWCYLSTTDCDCTNIPTGGYWCYDDQDPLSTNGGCISNISWLNTTQQQNLYGQNQTTYTSGGLSFASLPDCEARCRFCCDETGANGGYCEHVWDGFGCCTNNQFSTPCDWPTELDCSLNQTQYPCVVGNGDLYFCDLTQGCTQFPNNITPGSGPTGTGDGWLLLPDCIEFCAFDCGIDCECHVTLTPDYTASNPLNVCCGAPYPTLVGCVIGTANGDKCCDCVGCADNSVTYITSWDPPTSSWIQTPYTASNLINPPLPWDTVNPNINPYTGVQYTGLDEGVVVMFDDCCYMFLDAHSSYAQFAVTPAQNYNNYINNLASSNPADWPVLNTAGNNCLWWPCDVACPDTSGSTGSSQSWYCDANITTNQQNCVEDGSWGAVSSTYLDNVFGVGQVSHNNDPNNGFSSFSKCEKQCRFCCDEIIVNSCKTCCMNSAGMFYVVTAWPCKCFLFDTQVPMGACKGIHGPQMLNLKNGSNKLIEMETDSYLDTYHKRTGNDNRIEVLLEKYREQEIACRKNSTLRKDASSVSGDDCEAILNEMKVELKRLQSITNNPQSGSQCPGPIPKCKQNEVWNGWPICNCSQVQTGPQCPGPVLKCIPGEVWTGYPTCKCLPTNTSSTYECVLCWGETTEQPTMYSCETLTPPCGAVDPCDCLGKTVTWYASQHEGAGYVPLSPSYTQVPDSWTGPWYPNMVIPPSIFGDMSYTIDPYDGCCYTYSHHNGSGPTLVYGAIPPSQCYNNHIQGLYCDGTIGGWGSGNPFDSQQGEWPVWWPCDETCPDGNTKSWHCTITGCEERHGQDGYPSLQNCNDVCNEYQCDSATNFAGVSKCNVSFAMVSYVDSQTNISHTINSPLTYLNAFFNNNVVTFSNGSTGIPSGGPNSYSYYNTQPPLFSGQFLGCTDPGATFPGYQASTDSGFCLVSYQGNTTTSYATSQTDLVNNLLADGIDISGCDDFTCVQNIVLDPNDPNNNASFTFTTFEPDYRPCQCQTSSLDCSCYLIIGTGHTDAYENTATGYNDCLDKCCEGLCLDCFGNLAPDFFSMNDVLIHKGLSSYWGGAQNAFTIRTYSINECVTDPDNDCCLCCADNQLGNTSQNMINGFPGDCHLDVTIAGGLSTDIDLYDGTTTGTGMWVHCGVNEDNTSAGCPMPGLAY